MARDIAHATQPCDTTHRAGTQVNRSQGAQDTAQTTESTEPPHRGRRAKEPVTQRAQHSARSEPSGPGHRTRDTTHRAGKSVNRSHIAQEIADTTQNTDPTHRGTGAKSPRTPHTQHNTPSGHTGEQERNCPGHRTRDTTHRAGSPVNRSQVAQDTAQKCAPSPTEGWATTSQPHASGSLGRPSRPTWRAAGAIPQGQTGLACTGRNGNGAQRVGRIVVRHARPGPYPRTTEIIMTLPSRNRQTTMNKLPYTAGGRIRKQLTGTERDVPSTQRTFGYTTIGSSATEPTET